ncbi:MAG: hypothetical protein M3Y76_13985 [Chloroflexota bacterium]|nr:hypothetical protein [Chloroflexota bacterium]
MVNDGSADRTRAVVSAIREVEPRVRVTTAQLAALVKNGTVRYFLLNGSSGGGPGGGQSTLITWITQHSTAAGQWQSTSTSSGLGGAGQLYEFTSAS